MTKSEPARSVMETIESRLLLAVVSVLNNNDSGVGSLRAALAAAGAGDTVDLSGRSGTITLASALTVNKNLTITGPGAADLTISGNNAVRAFTIDAGRTVSISDMTVANCAGNTSGPAVAIDSGGTLSLSGMVFDHNTALQKGGAVYVMSSTVTLTNCTFTDNTVSGSWSAGGGMHADNSTVTVTGCTFADNTATAAGTGFPMNMPGRAYGGGLSIMGPGSATITNSTFTGNSAAITSNIAGDQSYGGGVLISVNNNFTMNNCTIAGNQSSVPGAGTSRGGGIDIYTINGTGSMANTIVAANTAETFADIRNTYALSAGHNLIGDGSGVTSFTNGNNGDLVGTTASPLDAKLDVLADNDGPTPTMALLAGSPAISAGGSGATATDQRGVTRDSSPEIGAFEIGSLNAAPVFSSTAITSVTSESIYTYEIAADDADSDPITITATSTLPAWLQLTDHGDGTATLTGIPENADAGSLSVTLRASDGTDDADQSFTIAVAAINHVPTVANSITTASVMTGFSFSRTVQASDSDSDTLTFHVVSKPEWITVTDNHDGTATLTGIPLLADAGDNRVVLKVNDGQADSQNRTIYNWVTVPRWHAYNGTLVIAADYRAKGNDVITATQVGNSVHVVHNGTAKDFHINIFSTVELHGFDGDDVLTLDLDTLSGYIVGGAGNDRLVGGDEDDILTGGGGKDTLVGGAGSDRLNGHNGNDKLDGGAGDDRLYGGEGEDRIFGGDGIDRFFGEEGKDLLYARNNDADILDGGPGADSADEDSLDTAIDALAALLA